ncbi:Uncharacterised protein [Vibrio cholerae]|nr:Uncharacterised protein [Vibrio cholerae]
MRLVSVDLPTFGRPMIASLIGKSCRRLYSASASSSLYSNCSSSGSSSLVRSSS